MRLDYNSFVVLTFTLISCAVMGLDNIFPGFAQNYFCLHPGFDFGNPMDYFRLVSHTFGHTNWAHLVGNFSFILLIGPILEEKYGSRNLVLMIVITALITGIFNTLLFSNGLMGASGVVFMMILLGSLVNMRQGTIPLTFVFILLLYIGREIYTALSYNNNISEFGHIVGGICGTFFGFGMKKREKPKSGA